MSDDIKKVQKGQPMRISASFYNGAVDAINDFRRRQQQQERWAMQPTAQSSIILVKNLSGMPRQRYEVLGLDSPVIPPSVNLAGFQDKLAMNASAPTAAHAGKYAVLQEPLGVGAIGKGMISGVTQVRIGTVAPEDLGCVLWQDSGWAIVTLGSGNGGAQVGVGKLAGVCANKAGFDGLIALYDVRAQDLNQRVTQTRIFPHLYLYGVKTGDTTPDLLYDFVVTNGSFVGSGTLTQPGLGLLPGQVFVAALSIIAPGFPVGDEYLQGKYEIRIGKGDIRRMTIIDLGIGPTYYGLNLGKPTWPSRKTTGGFWAKANEFVGGYLYPNLEDHPDVKFEIGSNYDFGPNYVNLILYCKDHSIDMRQWTAPGKIAAIEPPGSSLDFCVIAYETITNAGVTLFVPTGVFRG